MTQQEYEKKKRECWDKFWSEISSAIAFTSEAPDLMKKQINKIFDRAFALGKQKKDTDTVIQGWAAREGDGALALYSTKPERYEKSLLWMGRYANFYIQEDLFPDLTWESEPEPVEIIIKRKKKKE